MAVFLSILRGINVSGQKMIKMTDLKALYEELSFKNVSTYIQSGNVIFENKEDKELCKKIEKKIFEKYNFLVPVIIRSMEEMETTINGNMFLKEKKIELDKLHVTYLEEEPLPENLEKIGNVQFEPDRFYISGKDIYIYCPGGYGKTKLNNTFFENKLKVKATTRNWKTTNEILRIMKSYS